MSSLTKKRRDLCGTTSPDPVCLVRLPMLGWRLLINLHSIYTTKPIKLPQKPASCGLIAHSLISTAAWGWLTTAAFVGMVTWDGFIALWEVRLTGSGSNWGREKRGVDSCRMSFIVGHGACCMTSQICHFSSIYNPTVFNRSLIHRWISRSNSRCSQGGTEAIQCHNRELTGSWNVFLKVSDYEAESRSYHHDDASNFCLMFLPSRWCASVETSPLKLCKMAVSRTYAVQPPISNLVICRQRYGAWHNFSRSCSHSPDFWDVDTSHTA